MTGLQQERTEDVTVFPAPADGETMEINPAGFIWIPVDGAAEYELLVRDAATDERVLHEWVDTHYYVPKQPFPPGEYRWQFRVSDGDGTLIGERDPWTFHVAEDAPVTVCPSARGVLEQVTDEHPRLVFPASTIDTARGRIRAEQRRDLSEVVDDAYEMGMPPEPEFHLLETRDEQMQHYQDYFGRLRTYIDRNLRACALSYLLTEDADAGAFAREMLLHVCGWNPAGPNSVEWLWGDEPGLSYARVLPQVYDWTYDLYDDRERTYIEQTLMQYARQTYRRLRESAYFTNPSRSHLGRLPGYLGEMAILLEERLEEGEAEEMLQLVLDIFNTFFPYWGGSDGGWAQGISYGRAYNKWYVPFFATMERQTGFSFWDRPFYRRVRDFFIYCAPPNAEDLPFGDGQAASTPGADIRCLLELYAAAHEDPVAAWRASQIDAEGTCLPDLTGITYPRFEAATERTGPVVPDSKAFRDVGWAALHSDLMAPETDNYLVFRSSPYGNVSHSHNNQNAFCIASGGESLAISSGYYPRYGSAHHTEWTQRTKAHNSVLVDGEGQSRGVQATGKLSRFRDGDGYTYLCGEAADAYPDDRLNQFDRHVLFVEPGLYLVYDDLTAPTPSTFDWLLHTHEEPAIDTASVEIAASRGSARMRTRLFTDGAFDVDHEVGFDPPVNEGLIDELRQDRPDQHHVTATTGSRESAAILAVITVWQGSDEPAVSCTREGNTVGIEGSSFSGEVTLGADSAVVSGDIATSSGSVESIDLP